MARRRTAKLPERPRPAIASRQNKAEIIAAIAGETGLTQRQVAAVFHSLGDLVARHVKRRGSGEIVIPDTGIKVRRVRKPARRARTGHNPRTGEAIRIPGKPAGVGVKLTAMKWLKEAVKQH